MHKITYPKQNLFFNIHVKIRKNKHNKLKHSLAQAKPKPRGNLIWYMLLEPLWNTTAAVAQEMKENETQKTERWNFTKLHNHNHTTQYSS